MSKQEEIEIDYDDVEDPNYQIKLINSVKELIMHKFKKLDIVEIFGKMVKT